nr:hypothetical protein [Rhodococcus sp. 06-621-2]
MTEQDVPAAEGNTKKYMLNMQSTDEANEASKDMDFTEIINAMGAYNESPLKADVLLSCEGRTAPEDCFVVDCTHSNRR